MATIQSQLKLNDGMTSVLRGVTAALNTCLSSFERMQAASGQAMDVGGIAAARAELFAANEQITEMESGLRRIEEQQNGINASMRAGEGAAGGLLGKITQMAAAYMSVNKATGFLRENMSLSDSAHQAEMQLRVVGANVGLTEEAYKSLIDTASQLQSTTMYGSSAMVGAAAELATYISDADAVVVAMNTVADYAAGMSGGSELNTQQMVEYATQLGKVYMGAYDGIKKKGFELSEAQKKVMENGTDMEKALVLQDVIAESWDGLAASMASLPNGQITQTKNEREGFKGSLGDFAYPGVLGFFQTIQINMPQIQRLFYGLTAALAVVITWLGFLLDGAVSVYSFFADNWSLIIPIIGGIAAALLLYNGYLVTNNVLTAISNAQKGIAAVQAYKAAAANTTLAAMEQAEAMAKASATAAQYGFNAALLACPLTWILLIIIAVIAAIYLFVAAYNKWTDSTVSATGIIFGLLYSMWALIYNRVVVPWWNTFAAVANFIGNVFNDPVAAVKILFYDMAQKVIGYILNMARAIENIINKIPGVTVDITSGLDSFYNKLEDASQKVKDESGWIEYVGKLEYMDYGDAFNKGYATGQSVESSIKNFFSYDPGDLNNLYNGGPVLDGIASTSAETAANTGSTAASLKNMSEDLVYMRDLAEREAINRFTTAEIKVDMTGMTNRIDNKMDIDGVISRFVDGITEALTVTAEGVHA